MVLLIITSTILQTKENFSLPRIRTPHPNKAYRMNETPYLKNIKLALEQATTRPVTVFEKQRYLVSPNFFLSFLRLVFLILEV